jgi:hypothetical protein
MTTKKLFIAMTIFMCIGVLTVEAKKVKKGTEVPMVPIEEAPLIHDYLKLTFWFVTGIIVGVYF